MTLVLKVVLLYVGSGTMAWLIGTGIVVWYAWKLVRSLGIDALGDYLERIDDALGIAPGVRLSCLDVVWYLIVWPIQTPSRLKLMTDIAIEMLASED